MRCSFLVIAVFALAACQQTPAPTTSATPTPAISPAATVSTENVRPSTPHRFDSAIVAADFAEHVQTLASDEFEGRGPGTIGERATTAYLQSEFERLGLKPGNGDSYLQSVPMVETTVDPKTTLTFDVAGTQQVLTLGPDMVIGTKQAKPRIEIAASELVFVGYGVDAPAYQWNDYDGVDVKGKTVVVLINDPGFIRRDPELFKGPAMTYFGRWTYKYEEAARKGAVGCLIVHETAAAAYGWDVVRNSWSGPEFDLPPHEDADPRLQFNGWITGERAGALFKAAGMDFQALRLAADQRGFKAVPLQATLSTTIISSVRSTASDNVIATIPGTTRADEVVVFQAHWDHLGRTDFAPDGDKIFNGAVDNGTGVAGLLELAEAFSRSDAKLARTLVFLAPTLEESGLIGSRYYVNHPLTPMAKTVAVINMDAMPITGRARNMAVIGYGQNDLEQTLADVLKAQDRVVVPEPTPEKGFFYRSDQFNFAKKGVPALYARAGFDLREGGTAAGMAASEGYTNKRYHKTADEYDASWDLGAAIEDLQALYEVGRRVADSDAWPAWSEASEFRATREASIKSTSQ